MPTVIGISFGSVVLTAVASDLKTIHRSAAVSVSFGLRASSTYLLPGDPSSLRRILGSGYSKRFPFHFAEVPGGVVLITNGIDPMLRWDGSRSVEPAGVPSPDEKPTLAVTGTDASTAKLYAYVRFVDFHGNVSDFSPISEGVLGYVDLTSATYSGVPIPTGLFASKVCRRQLLRNTIGQADVWYVDLDTLDMTSTSFTSYNSDSDLLGNEAVALFDDLGAPSANTHGFPPDHKLAVVTHLGRVFAAGEVVYDEGHVAVTADSVTVTGVDTSWPVTFANRLLYVPGAPDAYEIESVNRDDQVITLTNPYHGTTNLFSSYGIRSAPSEKRLVYFTPPGDSESWPVTYALAVEDDGDEITGLMALSSFLYILEKRHIYRFTFKDDPGTDGAIFLSSQRGCLNQRLWAQAEDTAYLLDEQGIHQFQSGQSTPISAPIQDLFRDDTESPLRINWDSDQRLWHSVYSEVHATVRFFVAMTGTRLPRHAICYNYRDERWWIEEYQRPITCSTRANLGIARVLAGTEHREMLSLNVGWTDGARDPEGTLRGTVTDRSATRLVDTNAHFASDAVNLAVHMVSGRGKGQKRKIVSVEPTRLDLLTPWMISPEVGSSYAVAGIDWSWRGGWFRFTDETEADSARDIEMVYQKNVAGSMDLKLRYDHDPVAREWSSSRDGRAAVTAGRDDVVVDLASSPGWADFRLEGHNERYISSDTYVQPELSGVQVSEPIRIYRVTLDGVEAEG